METGVMIRLERRGVLYSLQYVAQFLAPSS